MQVDVAIVGGGHNGLVAAGYLARAGLDVVVAERRPLLGGATVTEEVLPGYRASTCAFVLGLFRSPILRDLELARHGLELFASPDVLATGIADDGRHLVMWRDLDRTLRDLEASVGRSDVEGFLRLGRALQRVGELYDPFVDVEPPTLDQLRASFAAAGAAELFERFFSASIAELLDEYVSSDLLRGFLAFPALVSVLGGPRTPGTSYVLTHHSVGEFEGSFGKWGFVRGGMGGLADALAASARSAGARLLSDAAVARVDVSGGRVTGIVLERGDEIRARTVLSCAEPTRTLLGLVGSGELPPEVVASLRAYDLSGSMARVFIAVEELPRFTGFPAGDGGVRPEHRGHLFLGPSIDRYERAGEAALAGRVPDDFVVEARIESALEPGLVPAGTHLVVTGVQQLPRELAAGTWDDARDDFQRRVVERLVAYAPNLDGRIIGARTITPLDLEREYGLTGGNIYHGAMSPTQLAANRPLPGSRPYRTPIAGLYLGGAGTHPGGGVMGAPGRSAALAILVDRGLRAADPARRPTGAAGARLIDAMLDRPRLRRLALAAAKQPLLRPVARRAMRRR